MDDKMLKSNQEAAYASWINYLNDLRLERLSSELATQERNFQSAISELDEMYSLAKETVVSNRGGQKGVHGFIAEIYQTGIENAKDKYNGISPKTVWVNDNSVADLNRGKTGIQLKFCEKNMSLDAIESHMEKYPDWASKGNKYMIPKDHYDKIKYYLSISEDAANKMPKSTDKFKMSEWKKVHEMFGSGKINLNKLEPSELTYKQVQKGNMTRTFHKQQKELSELNEQKQADINAAHKPSFAEGAKASLISGAIEGGVSLVTAIIQEKKKTGKKISEFTSENWKTILGKTGYGTFKGVVRGATLYAVTFNGFMNSFVANGFVTGAFSIAELIYKKNKYGLSNEQFKSECENAILSTAVSTVSSMLGNTLIPIPVLGAVIGNTIGQLLLQIANQDKEIRQYAEEVKKVREALDKEYQDFLTALLIREQQFVELMELAFVPDYNQAFQGSVQLATAVGVDDDQILKTVEDIDNYFTN